MFQQNSSQLLRRGRTDDGAWLSKLVRWFEETSRAELRAVPCDESVLLAVKAQLERPASARDSRTTGVNVFH